MPLPAEASPWVSENEWRPGCLCFVVCAFDMALFVLQRGLVRTLRLLPPLSPTPRKGACMNASSPKSHPQLQDWLCLFFFPLKNFFFKGDTCSLNMVQTVYGSQGRVWTAPGPPLQLVSLPFGDSCLLQLPLLPSRLPFQALSLPFLLFGAFLL